MLSCGTSTNNELLTSSDVPVKKEGEHFVTKAILGASDISIMKLRLGYTYATETFGTTEVPVFVLQKFRHHSTMRYRDLVYLDSPFSGTADRIAIGYERRLDSHTLASSEQPPDPEDRLLSINWLYVGNGHQEPLEGTCGSVIEDDDDNVVGFFRFANENEMALATSPAVYATRLGDYGDWELVKFITSPVRLNLDGLVCRTPYFSTFRNAHINASELRKVN